MCRLLQPFFMLALSMNDSNATHRTWKRSSWFKIRPQQIWLWSLFQVLDETFIVQSGSEFAMFGTMNYCATTTSCGMDSISHIYTSARHALQRFFPTTFHVGQSRNESHGIAPSPTYQ